MYMNVYVYVYAYMRAYACIHTYIHTYMERGRGGGGGEGGRSSSSSFVSPIAVDEIYIIMHYHEFVLPLNAYYHLRAKSIYCQRIYTMG